MTETFTEILGYTSDADIAERLHQMQHRSAVETIVLSREDTLRRRLRVNSDAGREMLIALPRDQQLMDGAILFLDDQRAVVVKMSEENWLRLLPAQISDAVELGYFAGNLHWRVKFNGPEIHIAVEGPESNYLERLEPFLHNDRVKRIDDD